MSIGFFRLLLIAIISLTFIACSEAPPPIVDSSRPVKMVTVGSSGVATFLEYPGKVSAATEATLAFEVSGKIIELPIAEGQAIEQGQLIAKLDSRDFQSNFDAANSQYQTAKANFDRAQELIKKSFISQADYDRLLTSLNNANADLEKAQKALQDSELRAPFAGVVADKWVDNFSNVQAKQTIIILHDQAGLEIDINIPENDWKYVEASDSRAERQRKAAPNVVVSTFRDKIFNAQFKSLSTIADPTTRTYAATLSFPAPDDIIVLPGMTAKVIMQIPSNNNGSRIPAQAVVSDPEGNAYVWLVNLETMTISKRSITLGEIVGTDIQVSGGLTNGETIAASGANQLRAGMTVSRYETQ